MLIVNAIKQAIEEVWGVGQDSCEMHHKLETRSLESREKDTSVTFLYKYTVTTAQLDELRRKISRDIKVDVSSFNMDDKTFSPYLEVVVSFDV